MQEIEEILIYFPCKLKKYLYQYVINNFNESDIEQIEEIRIRVNRPISFKIADEIILLDYIISQEEMLELFQRICENSIYSYTNQICNGYITVKGGHRIGISGSCVIENNRVINIKYISSLNIRIAREIIDSSKEIIDYIINKEKNSIYNTLIVSPPGSR